MVKSVISPDGKLQIIYHSGTFPIMAPSQVRGAVKNIGTENADAEIKVDFCNIFGDLLSRSEEVYKDIKPGEERLFFIGNKWSSDGSMTEVDKYKISVVKKD